MTARARSRRMPSFERNRQNEGPLLPPAADDLVHALPGDRRDAGAGLDHRRKLGRRGQGLQITGDELGAGREGPAAGNRQPWRCSSAVAAASTQ